MMMMVKKNSPQAFVLLLLLLCIASTCSVVATTSTNKSWKVETPSWETKKVGPNHYHSHENDGSEEVPAPWPLLVPRRKEETVLLRFTYGDQSKRKLETETTNEDEGSELSVHVTYEELYDIIVFLIVAWIMGRLAALVGMPTLVGEIISGFLLGPPVANFVPYPEAMVLIGQIGLIGLLLEAGVVMDVGQLKQSGLRAFFLASTGACLPLIGGIGLGYALGVDLRSAIAVGASFSPTSLGVASNALAAGNVYNTPVGQLIVAACVIDDIIGLIFLSVIQVLVNEDAQSWEYAIPVISSFGYLLILGYAAVTWMPIVIEKHILTRVPEQSRDLLAFGLMIMLTLIYLPILNYSRSSYLTGAFLAGLTFSQIHSVHDKFANEGAIIMQWLLRIFFSASIGFQIPIKMFGDPQVIIWGLLIYVLVLAKLPLGLFVPKFESVQQPDGFPFNQYRRDVIYVSVAMTCRGEFSFVIAAFGLSAKLFTAELYSSVVFAVLLSSITSPFVLLSIIKYYNQKTANFLALTLAPADTKDNKMPLYLSIQIRSPNDWGLQETISNAIRMANLHVIDHRSWHPRGLDATVMTELYVEDSNIRCPLPKQVTATNDVVDEQDEENEGASSIRFKVSERCEEVKKCIESALGHADEKTRITVSWWQPNAFADVEDDVKNFEDLSQYLKDIIKREADDQLSMRQLGTGFDSAAVLRNRRRVLTPKVGEDMWHQDTLAQKLAIDDRIRPFQPATDVTGRYPHRNKTQSDLSGFLMLQNATIVQERLAGFVRREHANVVQPDTPFARFRPGTIYSRNVGGAPNNAESENKDAAFHLVKMKSDLTGFFTANVPVDPSIPSSSRALHVGEDKTAHVAETP